MKLASLLIAGRDPPPALPDAPHDKARPRALSFSRIRRRGRRTDPGTPTAGPPVEPQVDPPSVPSTLSTLPPPPPAPPPAAAKQQAPPALSLVPPAFPSRAVILPLSSPASEPPSTLSSSHSLAPSPLPTSTSLSPATPLPLSMPTQRSESHLRLPRDSERASKRTSSPRPISYHSALSLPLPSAHSHSAAHAPAGPAASSLALATQAPTASAPSFALTAPAAPASPGLGPGSSQEAGAGAGAGAGGTRQVSLATRLMHLTIAFGDQLLSAEEYRSLRAGLLSAAVHAEGQTAHPGSATVSPLASTSAVPPSAESSELRRSHSITSNASRGSKTTTLVRLARSKRTLRTYESEPRSLGGTSILSSSTMGTLGTLGTVGSSVGEREDALRDHVWQERRRRALGTDGGGAASPTCSDGLYPRLPPSAPELSPHPPTQMEMRAETQVLEREKKVVLSSIALVRAVDSSPTADHRQLATAAATPHSSQPQTQSQLRSASPARRSFMGLGLGFGRRPSQLAPNPSPYLDDPLAQDVGGRYDERIAVLQSALRSAQLREKAMR